MLRTKLQVREGLDGFCEAFFLRAVAIRLGLVGDIEMLGDELVDFLLAEVEGFYVVSNRLGRQIWLK